MKKSLVLIISFILMLVVTYYGIKITEDNKEDAEKLEKIDSETYLYGTEVSAMHIEGNQLYISGKDGVQILNTDTNEITEYINDIEMIYAAKIIRCQEDLLIGHNDGVTIISENGRQDIKISEGRVNDLFYNEDNREVYIGTLEGLDIIHKKDGEWILKDKLRADTIGIETVNVMGKVHDEIWLGSYLSASPGGISIKFKENFKNLEPDLSHPYINAILSLDDDSILVGTGQLNHGGLDRIKRIDGEYRIIDTYNKEDGIPGEKVRYLYKDREGHLWITTESDGLIVLQSENDLGHKIKGIKLTEENGLCDNEVKCIVEDEDSYYLGCRYGVTKISKNKLSWRIKE